MGKISLAARVRPSCSTDGTRMYVRSVEFAQHVLHEAVSTRAREVEDVDAVSGWNYSRNMKRKR